MESPITKRIKEYILYKGIRINQFEQSCGLSNGYINQIKIYWRRKTKGYKSTFSGLKYLLDINRYWQYDTRSRNRVYR